MRSYTSRLIALCMLLLAISCNQSSSNKEQSETETTAPPQNLSSIAADEDKTHPERKFIRTADIKFKVKNVIQSTYDIESITSRHGGFVTHTNLVTHTDHTASTRVSADSSLETTHFTVSNSITLRVPNNTLDTTLKEIARNVDFLEYRIIKAEDVALQVLSNELEQIRMKENEERLKNAADNNRIKSDQTMSAEDRILSRQQQDDAAKLANLSLSDQVKYSTVTMQIYQRPSVNREMIFNEKNIPAYEPAFGIKFRESFLFGWNMIITLLLFFAKFWAIILVTVIGVILYRRFL